MDRDHQRPCLLVGAMSLVAGALRLGFINNFISKPVLDGFVAGLALNILIGQVPKFLGYDIGGDLNFFGSVGAVFDHLSKTNAATLAVGVGSFALLAWLHSLSSRLPAALITVVVSVLAVVIGDLSGHGVALIGEIPSGFPTLSFPGVGLDTFGLLIPGALGIMLVAYAETLSGGRTFAARRRYRIDPDQEFTAIGWANIGAGLFQGFAVNGSLSRTKLKYDVGVKTQYSTLFTGIAVLLTLLFLTWFFEDLAEATIAAIVIHAVAPLVRPRSWPLLWRTARFEFWAALAAALVTMGFGEVQGLFFGVLVAVVMVTARASAAPMVELGYRRDAHAYAELGASEDVERVPGVVILRAGATPFFANASSFHDAILDAAYSADPSPKAVVLDCDVVTSIDLTAAAELNRLADELVGLGVELRLARVSSAVAAELREQGVEAAIEPAKLFVTVREAVEADPAAGSTGLVDAPDR